PIVPVVLHHHEWYDGSGYPEGLKDDDIPLLARVLSVADSYMAMTTARPYRKGMPVTEVLERIREASGSQFDPVVVEALTQVIVPPAAADVPAGGGEAVTQLF
ncbi:MAG: HD domain-containing phosphohydrolase, partial [Pseudomonadota bacterium]